MGTIQRFEDVEAWQKARELTDCDGEGTIFINTCWSLAEPETRRRESEAMSLGYARRPQARGLLLFHEYTPGVKQQIPVAEPAWRFLTRKPAEGSITHAMPE